MHFATFSAELDLLFPSGLSLSTILILLQTAPQIPIVEVSLTHQLTTMSGRQAQLSEPPQDTATNRKFCNLIVYYAASGASGSPIRLQLHLHQQTPPNLTTTPLHPTRQQTAISIPPTQNKPTNKFLQPTHPITRHDGLYAPRHTIASDQLPGRCPYASARSPGRQQAHTSGRPSRSRRQAHTSTHHQGRRDRGRIQRRGQGDDDIRCI